MPGRAYQAADHDHDDRDGGDDGDDDDNDDDGGDMIWGPEKKGILLASPRTYPLPNQRPTAQTTSSTYFHCHV